MGLQKYNNKKTPFFNLTSSQWALYNYNFN